MFYSFKILDFACIYFWKKENFEFLVSKFEKIYLKRRELLCGALNFTSLGAFGLRFASNLHILEAFEHLLMFDPNGDT